MIPRNVWFVRVRTVRGLSGVSIGCAAAKNAPETPHLAVFDAKALRNLGGKWRKEKAKVGRFEKKDRPRPKRALFASAILSWRRVGRGGRGSSREADADTLKEHSSFQHPQ